MLFILNSSTIGQSFTPISISILIFFMVMSIAYYITSKKPNQGKRDVTYLFYGAYCLNVMLLFVRIYLIENDQFPIFLSPFNLVLVTTPPILYAFFIYYFINDIEKEQQVHRALLGKFVKYTCLFCITYDVLFFILYYINPSSSWIISMSEFYPKIIVFIGYFAIFAVFIRVKSKLINYIILGSIGIATGATLSVFLGESPSFIQEGHQLIPVKGKLTSLQTMFQIGTIFDVIIIAIALIKKNSIIDNKEHQVVSKPNRPSLRKHFVPLSIGRKKVLVDREQIIYVIGITKGLFEIYFKDQNKAIIKGFIETPSSKNVIELLDCNYLFFVARKRNPILIINRNFVCKSELKNRKYSLELLNVKETLLVSQNRTELFENWLTKPLYNLARYSE